LNIARRRRCVNQFKTAERAQHRQPHSAAGACGRLIHVAGRHDDRARDGSGHFFSASNAGTLVPGNAANPLGSITVDTTASLQPDTLTCFHIVGAAPTSK